MTRDECYESPKELYACDGLEYRTCSSSVSHYRAHDKRGKLDKGVKFTGNHFGRIYFFIYRSLRVVRTKAILFSKSMSERFGSDIERL